MPDVSGNPQGAHLVVIAKVAYPLPFADNRQDYRTFTSLLPWCQRIDLIVQSRQAGGHEEQDGALHVHAAPFATGWRGHVAFLRFARQAIDRLFRDHQPDVLWLNEPLDSGLIGLYARRRYRAPIALHVLGDLYSVSRSRFNVVERWLMARMTTYLARRADRTRTVAQAIGAKLLQAGCPPDRLVVLPMRTDTRLFSREAYRAERQRLRAKWGWESLRVVSFVGSLNDSKGVDMLLDAAAAVAERCPDLRYLLVGDGELAGALRDRAAALQLHDRVLFTGRVPHDEVPWYLAASDAFCLSSRDEGLPRCVIEASSMELPVVTTRVGGTDEVIVDGETGWIVPPTVPGLTDGLLALGQVAPAALAAMGRRGRERMIERFDLDKCLEALAREMILEVIDRRAVSLRGR